MNTPRTTRPRTDWNQAAMLLMLGALCMTIGGMVVFVIKTLPQ